MYLSYPHVKDLITRKDIFHTVYEPNNSQLRPIDNRWYLKNKNRKSTYISRDLPIDKDDHIKDIFYDAVERTRMELREQNKDLTTFERWNYTTPISKYFTQNSYSPLLTDYSIENNTKVPILDRRRLNNPNLRYECPLFEYSMMERTLK